MKNLGYLTDAIFHQRDGEIIDRGDYYLIRTPTNPTYFWGNYLLFKSTPEAGSFEKWMAIHEREFGKSPAHIAMGWDTGEKGELSDFLENGFRLEDGIVLELSGKPTPVPINQDLEIRSFSTDQDWQASIDLQVTEGCYGISEEDYRIFKIDQMRNYRLNQEKGHGHWWGAFLGEELVGDMGLFFDATGAIGRFQNVGTAKAHRRKGVCTTLLNTVVRQSLARAGVNQLVIVTDQGSIAEKIYRSLGFRKHTFQFGLIRRETA